MPLHRDGFLAIDNNVAERALRGIAIGREDWPFCGSDQRGRTAVVLASVRVRCQRHRFDPFVYLRDVLTRLPEHPADPLEDFLPGRWVVLAQAAAPASASAPNPLLTSSADPSDS